MLHEHDHPVVELLVAFDDGVLQVVQVCTSCLAARLRDPQPSDAGLPLINGPQDTLSGENSTLTLVAS